MLYSCDYSVTPLQADDRPWKLVTALNFVLAIMYVHQTTSSQPKLNYIDMSARRHQKI